MGWIRNTATNTPLKAPKSMATTKATRKATRMGACRVSGRVLLPQSTRSSTLPLMAMAAPTLISCPPLAAVTSVMPMARIASSEPLSRMLIRKPESTGFPALFSSIVIAKEDGSRIRLNRRSAARAARGMNIWFLVILVRRLPSLDLLTLFVPIVIFHLRQWYS